MVKPRNRRDLKSRNLKSMQQHNILDCLTTWRDVNGHAKLFNSVLGSSKQDKLGHKGVHIEEKDAKVSSNIKKCLCKVAYGHFIVAMKVLGSYGVSPYYEYIMKALEAKPPYKTSSSMPTTTTAKNTKNDGCETHKNTVAHMLLGSV